MALTLNFLGPVNGVPAEVLKFMVELAGNDGEGEGLFVKTLLAPSLRVASLPHVRVSFAHFVGAVCRI